VGLLGSRRINGNVNLPALKDDVFDGVSDVFKLDKGDEVRDAGLVIVSSL